MPTRLEIAALFIAVGLGALTVTLLRDPGALVPHPPYWPWFIGRLFLLGALAALGMLLMFGLEDDDDMPERPIRWRAIGLAFLVSVLASATFIAVSAFVDYLDRAGA